MPDDADVTLPLAQVVRALRAELESAFDERRGHALQFELGPVELELQLELSREASGDAGVRFWVVSLGGAAKRTDATTHRVKLTLQPVVTVATAEGVLAKATAMLHDSTKSEVRNFKA